MSNYVHYIIIPIALLTIPIHYQLSTQSTVADSCNQISKEINCSWAAPNYLSQPCYLFNFIDLSGINNQKIKPEVRKVAESRKSAPVLLKQSINLKKDRLKDIRKSKVDSFRRPVQVIKLYHILRGLQFVFH